MQDSGQERPKLSPSARLSAGVRRAAFRFPSVQGPAAPGCPASAATAVGSKPTIRCPAASISGRRISSGSASSSASASSRSSASGITSPDLTRGAARLNQSATGKGRESGAGCRPSTARRAGCALPGCVRPIPARPSGARCRRSRVFVEHHVGHASLLGNSCRVRAARVNGAPVWATMAAAIAVEPVQPLAGKGGGAALGAVQHADQGRRGVGVVARLTAPISARSKSGSLKVKCSTVCMVSSSSRWPAPDGGESGKRGLSATKVSASGRQSANRPPSRQTAQQAASADRCWWRRPTRGALFFVKQTWASHRQRPALREGCAVASVRFARRRPASFCVNAVGHVAPDAASAGVAAVDGLLRNRRNRLRRQPSYQPLASG